MSLQMQSSLLLLMKIQCDFDFWTRKIPHFDPDEDQNKDRNVSKGENGEAKCFI